METDNLYSYIEVCPKTGTQITDTNGYGGVCPFCGDDNTMSFIHSKKVVGRVVRPTFYEWLVQGKRKEFLRKEDEDEIMEKLSQ